MIKLEGKSISKKVAFGKVFFYEKKGHEISREKVSDVDAEIERFHEAKEKAKEQLEALYDKAMKEVGESGATLFEVHQMMLDDDDYNESIESIIKEDEINAEAAVSETGKSFAEMFASMDDDYMKAREADVRDISDRLVRILSGSGADLSALPEPVILVADDLAPSETVQLDKSKLLGFVTEHGSSNSHTAILARTMNIPAVISIPIDSAWNGRMCILDGDKGTVIIDPDEDAISKARDTIKKQEERERLLNTLKGLPTVTKSGRKVRLFANIGGVSDADVALSNDAEGVGLFRSEFLYLESDDYPSEEAQFEAYKAVVEKMAPRNVVIRTLDIGADKKVAYFKLDPEENPALGYRAIRICLTRVNVFKTQLRALLRASAFGNLSIMFPMIISVKEVKRIKEILEEVKQELRSEKKDFKDDIEIGVMIETPASVLVAEDLAKEVNFFSIGTNDLTQYTLAIDRQNTYLDPFLDRHHPAILKEIQMTIEAGHKHGAWVGICGELGADPELTGTFIKMGIDELSVSPGSILPLRERIRNME